MLSWRISSSRIAMRFPRMIAATGLLLVCLGMTVYTACSVHTAPPSRVDHMALGQAFFKDGAFERACDELELAVTQAPRNLEAQALLGLSFAKRDMPDPAIAHLEAPAANNLPRVDVYAALARMYQKKKMYGEALAAAVKAKKLAPES